MIILLTFQKVVEINDLSGDDLPDTYIIKYFKNSCGHCQAARPKYEQVSKALSNLTFYELDCNKHPADCGIAGINAYPTFKLTVNGSTFSFNGNIESGPLQTWIELMLGPVLEETPDNMLKIRAERAEFASFYVLHSNTPEKYLKIFQELQGKYVFGLQKTDELKDFIVAHRGEKQIKSEFLTKEAIKKFVSQHSVPVFSTLTRQNFLPYAETTVPLVFIHGKRFEKELEQLADSMQLTAQFGVLNDERVRDYVQANARVKANDFIAAVHQRGGKKPLLVANKLTDQPLDVQVVTVLEQLEQAAIGIRGQQKTFSLAKYFCIGIIVSVCLALALGLIFGVLKYVKSADRKKQALIAGQVKENQEQHEFMSVLNAIQE